MAVKVLTADFFSLSAVWNRLISEEFMEIITFTIFILNTN